MHFVLDIVLLLLISLIVLIFGEIVPKALGLSFPTKYVNTYSRIVVAAGKLVYPFIWIASKISNVILGFYKTKYLTELDLVYSEEEIRMMISRSHEEGQLDQVESELIDNVFNFVDRMAKEVMVPRQDVDCVFVEDGYDEAMKVIRSKVHTRYPLCVEDKDHIIGLVHIKDLMERPNQARKDLRNIKRDILTVPEVMKLSTLLQYMRTRRIYLAVVVDEYGGMAGLVTLEDLLEEIVGEIDDETDRAEIEVHQIGEDTYIAQGTMNLNDFNNYFGVELESDDVDTIAGYYLTGVGTIPTTEKISYELVSQNKQIVLTNDKVKNGRVTKVKVQITELEPEEETE